MNKELKFVKDHKFVVSDFPPPDSKVVLSRVLYDVEWGDISHKVIDARKFNDRDLFLAIYKDTHPIIFWLGRNLLFERGYVGEKGWGGMDSVSLDNIIFYDPYDVDLFYSLSEFDLPESIDCWSQMVQGWWVGRYGAQQHNSERYKI